MADLPYPIKQADLTKDEADEIDALYHAYKDERKKNKAARKRIKELRTKLAAQSQFKELASGRRSTQKANPRPVPAGPAASRDQKSARNRRVHLQSGD